VSDRRNLVIAIVASFVFGLSGGAIAAFSVIAALHAAVPQPFPRGPEGPQPRFGGGPPIERQLARRLDLTEDQRVRVHEILEHLRPRYAAVQESTRAAIEEVLTPEQRERWRQLERQFRGSHLSDRPRRRGSGF
jgi:Spy/CpxP family protein refolding chaperone